MDPEMMRLAQEQMSRIPPDQLMRMQQQMMNNPDLIRMATEGMKNLKPDDVRFATEQIKRLSPEDMAQMSSRMSQASPEEIAAMRVQAEAQRTYEFQGALTLKNQGNQLHGIGKYSEAAEKYQRAKDNLSGMTTSEASNLRLACSLNLMSCYLKTQQYDKTVAEGSEILENDSKNLKALYRRGQAYKELGQLKLALTDLNKAAQVAPDDETVEEVLRTLKEEFEQQGGEVDDERYEPMANGPVIEEISEEEAENLTTRNDSNTGLKQEQGQSIEDSQGRGRWDEGFSQTLNTLKQNPDMIRNIHTLVSHVDPEQIASMSGGEMNAEMAKLASDMVKQMSPEDMQRMVDVMGTAQRQGVANGSRSSAQATFRGPSNSGRVASHFDSLPEQSSSSDRVTQSSNMQREQSGNTFSTGLEGSGLSHRPGPDLQSVPSFGPELQEQMRQQMQDPVMKQMMASMVKNMTPETMASMSEQMGVKMSLEEAQQAQRAMANLSPDDLDKLMRWADRAQRLWEHARKAKNFLLGKPGLVLALVMLIIAVVLHWCGFIGN